MSRRPNSEDANSDTNTTQKRRLLVQKLRGEEVPLGTGGKKTYVIVVATIQLDSCGGLSKKERLREGRMLYMTNIFL